MRASFTPGALVASLAAGPLFILPIIVLSAVTEGLDDNFPLVALPLALIFSMPFGFVISLIPNLIGAAVMASIGERNLAARHPLAWAASGLIFGAPIGALCWPDLSSGVTAMSGVGMGCALVSRCFVQWPD